MNADDDTSTDPTESVDPARSRLSKRGLAAATLAALRAGVRSEPSPAVGPGRVSANAGEPIATTPAAPDVADLAEAQPSDGSGREPTSEIATQPVPTSDANEDTDPETDADYDEAGTDRADNAGPVRYRLSVLTAVCTIIAVAALVFASIAGVRWWQADHSTARKIGVAREQIDADARLAIVTVNTSDYRHPSDALANWLDVSTGALHAQFSQSRTTVIRLLARAKMITKATVLDAAVTALDLTKGTASVIASVNVTRSPATGAVSTVRNRFRASMTRIGGEWKLSDLGVVPVSLS
jgi:Mce-associated membrane protein